MTHGLQLKYSPRKSMMKISAFSSEMEGKGAYNKYATCQVEVFEKTRSNLEQAVKRLLDRLNGSKKRFTLADLGTSQGLNSMPMIDFVLQKYEEHCKDPLEFMVYHEDQPSNDFISLFDTLHSDVSYLKKRSNAYSAVISKSFYDRLFPSNSVDHVVCYTSLQWLSHIPCTFEGNRNCHIQSSLPPIEETNPKAAAMWKECAQADLVRFLHLRSEELVNGGSLCATMVTPGDTPARLPEVLANLLTKATERGLLSNDEAESFVIPSYLRTQAEVIEAVALCPTLQLDEITEFTNDYTFKDAASLAGFLLSIFKPCLLSCVRQGADEPFETFLARKNDVDTFLGMQLEDMIKQLPVPKIPMSYIFVACSKISN